MWIFKYMDAYIDEWIWMRNCQFSSEVNGQTDCSDQIHPSSIFKVALKNQNSDVFADCFSRASIQSKADGSKMYILSALNRRPAFQTRLSDIRNAIINNALFFPPAALFPLGHGRPRNICGCEMKAWQPVTALVCLARGPLYPRWAQWIDNLTERLLVLANCSLLKTHTHELGLGGKKIYKNKNNNNDRRIQPVCWSPHLCLYFCIKHVFFPAFWNHPSGSSQKHTHTGNTPGGLQPAPLPSHSKRWVNLSLFCGLVGLCTL